VSRTSDGSALVEFALAWPVALLLVCACVQLAVWGAEQHAARSAALSGARAGSAADGSPAVATEVALEALRPSLIAAAAREWCPGDGQPAAGVWVCARALEDRVDVRVGGHVPALMPLAGSGLPLSAEADVGQERFAP
jgi:hypothetical protein